jgi:Lactonase, 7-bladed beta-propeller
MRLKFVALAITSAIALVAALAIPTTASTNKDVEDKRDDRRDDRSAETIFTSSNEASGNRVLGFQAGSDGKLALKYSVPTGGTGSGGGLGNQDGIKLSPNRRWLLVVNAGSDNVSVFDTVNGRLKLVSRAASNGKQPVSITVRGSIAYVVNAGSDNVSGFFFNQVTGKLTSPAIPLPSRERDFNPAPLLTFWEKDLYSLRHKRKGSSHNDCTVRTQSICEQVYRKWGTNLVQNFCGFPKGVALKRHHD